jgi:hypothetical protein
VGTHEPCVRQEEESHDIDGEEQHQNHDRHGPKQSANGDYKETEHRR